MTWRGQVAPAEPAVRGGSGRAVALLVLLAAELLALAVAYQLLADFECANTDAAEACVLLRSFVARGVTALAAALVYGLARDGEVRTLLAAGQGRRAAPWLVLHGAGLLLILAPLLVTGGVLGPDIRGLFLPWIAGGAACAVGALFWLAPPRAWFGWLRQTRGLPLAVVLAGALVPDLGVWLLPLWDIQPLTSATFRASAWVLHLAGAAPQVDPGAYLIGIRGFVVEIAPYCSGVEGFALVTAFVVLHGLLFRAELRLGRYWLVVLPVAIGLSWVLNVVRLAGLVAIGGYVSPGLAINGFHSYAGWMFFTLLALGLLFGLRAVPFLWKDAPAVRPGVVPLPASGLDAGAMILPFVAFMVASVVGSALAPQPGLAYPLAVVAMAAVLAVHARSYLGLGFRLDPVALAAGLAVGVLWIATRAEPGAGDLELKAALEGLAPWVLGVWIGFRIAGTALLVPVVEELFFRGYILTRLDGPGPLRRGLAIAVSAGFFALLHGRWLAAGIAGVVFGLVMLRRGRVVDAIVAHAVANLAVAAWALAAGDWSVI